jgi:phosphate acetyltransferase
MPSCVYVTASQPRSGKSVVALGMVELLAARVGRVGFFRPVVDGDPDPQTELVRRRYRLEPPYEALRALTAADARDALARGAVDEVEEQVVRAHRALAERCDAVVCEGIDLGRGMDAERGGR